MTDLRTDTRLLAWSVSFVKHAGAVKVGHVRFGSLADFFTVSLYVRFTPESGHSGYRTACPLSAISGHRLIH